MAAAPLQILRDDLLTEAEVANELRVTTWCLKRRRERRQAPAYVKVGRLVRYRRSDIQAFMQTSTVYPAGGDI